MVPQMCRKRDINWLSRSIYVWELRGMSGEGQDLGLAVAPTKVHGCLDKFKV